MSSARTSDDPTRKAAAARWRPLAVGLIWLSSAVAGVAAGRSELLGGVQLFGYHRSMPTWVRRSMERDPKVGRRIDAPQLVDLEGRSVPLLVQGRPRCVLFVWHCMGCSVEFTIQSFDAFARRCPQAEPVVVVVRGRESTVREFWKQHGLQVPVLIDRDGELARRLNAVFLARTYLFDRSGTLRYISRHDASQSTIQREIEKRL